MLGKFKVSYDSKYTKDWYQSFKRRANDDYFTMRVNLEGFPSNGPGSPRGMYVVQVKPNQFATPRKLANCLMVDWNEKKGDELWKYDEVTSISFSSDSENSFLTCTIG